MLHFKKIICKSKNQHMVFDSKGQIIFKASAEKNLPSAILKNAAYIDDDCQIKYMRLAYLSLQDYARFKISGTHFYKSNVFKDTINIMKFAKQNHLALPRFCYSHIIFQHALAQNDVPPKWLIICAYDRLIVAQGDIILFELNPFSLQKTPVSEIFEHLHRFGFETDNSVCIMSDEPVDHPNYVKLNLPDFPTDIFSVINQKAFQREFNLNKSLITKEQFLKCGYAASIALLFGNLINSTLRNDVSPIAAPSNIGLTEMFQMVAKLEDAMNDFDHVKSVEYKGPDFSVDFTKTVKNQLNEKLFSQTIKVGNYLKIQGVEHENTITIKCHKD